jgi:hypothetical protein
MLGELDVFHVGVVVDDLTSSMATIGATLGIGWAPVQERVQIVRTGAGEVRHEPIRFTYSAAGPLHVELIESTEESVWETCPPGGLHHIGAFSDDVTTPPSTEMTLEFGGGDRDAPVGFAYYTAPSGLRIELVDRSRRDQFEAWFAGADLAAASRR